MNISKATNSQLMNILKYDNSIPNDLLKIVVNEAINRNLLEGYVKYIINKRFTDLQAVYQKYNVSYDDLMQIAYIAIWRATDTFKKGKAGFISCFFLPIQRSLSQFVRDNNSQKRKGVTVSIEKPVFEELTIGDVLPNKINVEKYVLDKLEAEEYLNLLTERNRKVVWLYVNGYSVEEIAKRFGMTRFYPNTIYRRSIKLMRGAI